MIETANITSPHEFRFVFGIYYEDSGELKKKTGVIEAANSYEACSKVSKKYNVPFSYVNEQTRKEGIRYMRNMNA